MPTKKTNKKTPTKKTSKTATKKATKKSTKSTTRKVATKSTQKAAANHTNTKTRALVCASAEQCFWTTDGRVLAHLEDLELAFGSMDESVFLYHANQAKNDFSDWVEHVLEDAALAASLRRSRKPHTAQKLVRKHLRDQYDPN